jgi:hypothetical protein
MLCDRMKQKSSKSTAPTRGEELTLRIEGALVTPEDFMNAVSAFVGLLKNVTGNNSNGGKKPGNGSGKRLSATSKSADFLKGTLGVQKSSIGSIEGRLSTISERNAFQFVVFDALSDRGVNCFVAEDTFREVHAAFGRRVSVFGIIQHDEDGRALSIQVESIRVLKDLCDLPPISSFKGMLKTA